MFNDIFRLFFIILCLFLIFVLGLLTVLMYKNKNQYRTVIGCSIGLGILTTIFYIIFLCFKSEKSHDGALLFCSLFYVGTDFLAMSMLIFAMKYTDMLVRKQESIIIICNAVCWVDSGALLINNIYKHMFDVVYLYNWQNLGYWGVDFNWPHYIHLMICYVMVGTTFILFIVKTIKCARLYKEKYLGVLLAYLVVIAANMLCYSLNTTFDVSVILYSMLAGFICYYATFSFPHKLLHHSLHEINETISDGLMYYDLNGKCVYANKVAKLIFPNEKGHGKKNVEIYRNDVQRRVENKKPDEVIIETFEVEGETRQYELEFEKEFFQDIEIGWYIRLIDKTFLLETYEKERNEAIHDDLTGLLNRQGFFEAVDEYIRKNGIAGRFMVCSDIKDFKLINELFGEKIGDEVLIKQAQLLTKNSHPGTIYGRIGDDTFALFVDKQFLSEEYLQHCMNILKTITDSTIYQMYIHAGIYELTDPTEDAQQMCDKALMSIDTIKDSYQKVFAYYDSSLMEKLVREKNIANQFPEALENGNIEMYLQPIIDSKNASFGAEALCRWNHPKLGLLRPTVFLSVLEKSGLIFQLDEYIWNCAAKKIHEWNEQGFLDCYISVNISEKDFYYTDVYKTFTQLVDKYDINPSSLHIEITEAVIMVDFKKALILAENLKKFGFGVSIDNFGNGFSSLNMLKDFIADTIKIDMTFLSNTTGEDRNQIILETIVTMTNDLKMKVIGEGVEEKNQYDLLRKYGCSIFQGHYLAEPLSVAEYEQKFINFSSKK